jgi:hypothetical protein
LRSQPRWVYMPHCSLLVPPFIFFWGLYLWHLWLALPSFPMVWFSWWLLSNCSCCSLLKAIHPEMFPDKVRVSPVVYPSSFFSVWVGAESPMMSLHTFSAAWWKIWLLALRPPVWWLVWGSHKMSPCSPGAAPVSGLSLMPLLRLGCTQCIFSKVHPLGVPCTTLSLPGPWRTCPLRSVGMAQWIVLG